MNTVFCRRATSSRFARLWLLATVAALATASILPAADLRLYDRCDVAGPVVTLGDVAEIVAADPTERGQLAALELFPAPQPGKSRFVRQREIEDLLVLRGVNLLGHRFSGASQVTVVRGEASLPQDAAELRVAASVMRRAERLVQEAIVRHLNQQATVDEPWSLQFEMDPRYAEAVSLAGEAISVRGGMAPWTGQQQFELSWESSPTDATFTVAALVSLPPAVAVAQRPLQRGTLIQAADFSLERGLPGTGEEGIHSIEELVGKETTRAIPAGKVIESGMVRSPLLVHRGQVVTVHANRSGIRVRTTARAREDGSLGDLIAVESLTDRTAFFARVCNVQEVEVFARALPAGGEASN